MELPDRIGLISLRELAPLIGQLRRRHDLNILNMEILAASVHLGATVFLSAPSPRLQRALAVEGRSTELVGWISAPSAGSGPGRPPPWG